MIALALVIAASKICPVCGRPFRWRRRYARCWDEVVHCSERCRRNRHD